MSVPKHKYNEADLPSTDLDYGHVSNQQIMQDNRLVRIAATELEKKNTQNNPYSSA